MNEYDKSLIKESAYYFTVITKSIITFKDHDAMLIWQSLILFLIRSLPDISTNVWDVEPIKIMTDNSS